MPNTNPAGPYQPQKHHAAPQLFRRAIGFDGYMFSNLQAGETLLIPSVEEVIRDLSFAPGQAIFSIDTTAAVSDATDFTVFLRGVDGKEYLLNEPQTIPMGLPATVFSVAFSGLILYKTLFEGLFVRFAGGVGGSFNFLGMSSDLRDHIVYTKVSLTTPLEFVQVSPVLSANEGTAAAVLPQLATPGFYGGWFNFDNAAPHNVFLFYEDNNGNQIPVNDTPQFLPTSPGANQAVAALVSVGITSSFTPEVSLKAVLLDPVTPGTSVDLIMYYALTNWSPVRTYQGGAY